jgi:hypothetical protein
VFKISIKSVKEIVHVEDFIRVNLSRVVGLDVEIGSSFLVFPDNGNVDHKLVFAVVAVKIKKSFLLES